MHTEHQFLPTHAWYSGHANLLDIGWQRQAESSELAAATHRFSAAGVLRNGQYLHRMSRESDRIVTGYGAVTTAQRV